jgi:Transposase
MCLHQVLIALIFGALNRLMLNLQSATDGLTVVRRICPAAVGHEMHGCTIAETGGIEVQHTGVKELRAFVKGLLKGTVAVRTGLSLVWSNGPTESFIHRLKRLKRQAYGSRGRFLRHRILAPSVGACGIVHGAESHGRACEGLPEDY